MGCQCQDGHTLGFRVTQGDRSSLGVPSVRVGVTVCVVVGDGVSAGGNAGDGVVENV